MITIRSNKYATILLYPRSGSRRYSLHVLVIPSTAIANRTCVLVLVIVISDQVSIIRK